MTNGNGNKSVLSTWQWLGVLGTVIAASVGLDQRMRSTVSVFTERNDADHQIIRQSIKDLSASIPPKWFKEQVDSNSQSIRRLDAELAALRIAITELTATARELKDRLRDTE